MILLGMQGFSNYSVQWNFSKSSPSHILVAKNRRAKVKRRRSHIRNFDQTFGTLLEASLYLILNVISWNRDLSQFKRERLPEKNYKTLSMAMKKLSMACFVGKQHKF